MWRSMLAKLEQITNQKRLFPFFAGLTVISTIFVSFLLMQALEPNLYQFPQSMVSEIQIERDSSSPTSHTLERYRYWLWSAASAARSVEKFASSYGAFKKPVRLVITSDPFTYSISTNEIRLGSALVQRRGAIATALVELWMHHNLDATFLESPFLKAALRAEIGAQVFGWSTTDSLMAASSQNWLLQLRSIERSCERQEAPLERLEWCERLRAQTQIMGLLDFSSSSDIARTAIKHFLESEGPLKTHSRRKKWFSHLRQPQLHQGFPIYTFPELNKTLQREMAQLFPTSETAPVQKAIELWQLDREVSVHYEIESPHARSFKISKQIGILRRPSQSESSTWLLPSGLRVVDERLPVAPYVAWISCGTPHTRDVLEKFNYAQRILIVKSCAEEIDLGSYQKGDPIVFGRANPHVSYFHLQVPALKLAAQKGWLNLAAPVEELVYALRKPKDAPSKTDSASWTDLTQVSVVHGGFRLKSAIDVVDAYRL